MDDDYAWLKEEAKHLTMAPSAYLKRNCYVTCEVDEKPLPLAIEEFGAERICLATDFPHFGVNIRAPYRYSRNEPTSAKSTKSSSSAAILPVC